MKRSKWIVRVSYTGADGQPYQYDITCSCSRKVANEQVEACRAWHTSKKHTDVVVTLIAE